MNLMKNLSLVLVISLVLPSLAQAEDIIRIELGRKSNRKPSTEEMMDRIAYLERAVDQLQRRVFQLEDRPVTIVQPTEPQTTCYVEGFPGNTYTATEATETAARAKAMKQCRDADSIHCRESNMKCGK